MGRFLPSTREPSRAEWKPWFTVWNREGVWSGRAGDRAVDVGLMPPLEHDELPQPECVIAFAGEMLVHEQTHERRLEVAALQRARRQQRVGEQLAQLAPEPHTDRHTKTLFPPVDDFLRQ